MALTGIQSEASTPRQPRTQSGVIHPDRRSSRWRMASSLTRCPTRTSPATPPQPFRGPSRRTAHSPDRSSLEPYSAEFRAAIWRGGSTGRGASTRSWANAFRRGDGALIWIKARAGGKGYVKVGWVGLPAGARALGGSGSTGVTMNADYSGPEGRSGQETRRHPLWPRRAATYGVCRHGVSALSAHGIVSRAGYGPRPCCEEESTWTRSVDLNQCNSTGHPPQWPSEGPMARAPELTPRYRPLSRVAKQNCCRAGD
jgi:hypothetical protein